ncbi:MULTISPECIES: FAD-binding oxidoreductase [unclassified Kitasatospora]|uniref:FAD-binding oxidoreductase n=1 Tax=unclassified Kitasatospora TaxID=2633591 RepID=UPI00340B6C0F
MSSQDFHPLTVQDISRPVEDAVTVTFAVPDAVRDEFRYQPGQYVMVRRIDADGEETCRSYSICQAPPADDGAPASLRIAVKLLGPGGFAEFAHARLRPGDTVDVLPPTGRFRLRPGRRHLAVAAGSGITPVLAMAEAALRRGDEFALILGNRTSASVLFADELAELRHRFAERFTVLHVLSREQGPDPLRTGRIDPERLPELIAAAGCATTDPELQYYLCGPAGLVATVGSFLADAGIERRRIHCERFVVAALAGL